MKDSIMIVRVKRYNKEVESRLIRKKENVRKCAYAPEFLRRKGEFREMLK